MLLQNSEEKERMNWASKGLEGVMKITSTYRKRDPRDPDEIEFMENAFGCICEILGFEKGKRLFLDEEGLELMTMVMEQKLLSRTRAIKVIDFLLSSGGVARGGVVKEGCERFVELGGLKSLFSAFMGKVRRLN
jgi:beta-catenin-like protein 1